MTEPHAPDPAADPSVPDHQHLDLDGLADVLAGEREIPACADCTAALADLERASAGVTAALSLLPDAALPDDVARRLELALQQAGSAIESASPRPDDGATAGASITTLPVREESRPPRRWLPAAAAAVILVGGVGLGVSTLGGGGSDSDLSATSAEDAGAGGLAGLVRNDSGRNYDKASLPSSVAGILAGKAEAPTVASAPMAGTVESSRDAKDGSTAGSGGTGGGVAATPPADSVQPFSAAPQSAVADELARLRSTEGLAACLTALLPPDDESVQPLALDYARFDGEAALLVVLPVPNREDKVDVFVVGADCAPADEDLLFFSRVDRPAG